jgi:hypothetical protein
MQIAAVARMFRPFLWASTRPVWMAQAGAPWRRR